MAEFLHILAEQYDYPQLADEILRELSNKEFNSNDTKGPKSVSAFMIKLSELAPRLVIKLVTLLAKQLDSEVRELHETLIIVAHDTDLDFSSRTLFDAPLSKYSATWSPFSARRMTAERITRRR
jgi:hypothetical protein